jgi:hypothetical protein
MHFAQCFFHCRKQCCMSCKVRFFRSLAVSRLMSSTSPKCSPPHNRFHFREQKKSHRGLNQVNLKGDPWVIMSFLAENSPTVSTKCEGALSWCRIQLFSADNSGHTCRTHSRRCFKTSTWNAALTVWACGINSWRTTPRISKKHWA